MSSYVDNQLSDYFNNVESDVIVFIPEFIENGMFGIVLPNVIPLTPLRDGYLETSLTVTAEGDTAHFNMSAFSDKGYDYAEIQHEAADFNHPLRGQDQYLVEGVDQSLDDVVDLLEEGIILIFEKNK